jgi:hypothetical protein
MQQYQVQPELREVVAEASRSLAQLDAARLEELAVSCQALNRELAPADSEEFAALTCQAREAVRDMAVFAQVLTVTKENLDVMTSLREQCAERLEYGSNQARGWVQTGSRDGNN